MAYIDLTHAFTESMPVYPGDSLPELHQIIEAGHITHCELKTGMHVGTHMDAPLHMIAGGKYLSDYPLEKFFGRGVLIDARGQTLAGADLLSNAAIRPGDIVLVCFGWSKKFRDPKYYQNYPELTLDFAQKLIDLDASIIGVDTPSPDTPPFDVHKMLLAKDVLLIENLNNLEALIGHPNFEVIALPIKLKTEAAPCRVVAKII